MKNLFLLLFLVLSGAVTAQTKLYTPRELKEDADYYFSTLCWAHPNPYYFYSANKFNKMKNSIYKDLDQPLSKTDFILTIARINSLLDSHSVVPLQDPIAELLTESLMKKMKNNIIFQMNAPQEECNHVYLEIDSLLQGLTPESLNEFLKEKNIDKDSVSKFIFFLPPVEVRGNDLFFSEDSVNNITEINGILVETIISDQKKYFNKKLNPKTNLKHLDALVNIMILGKYDINPPFRIKFGKTGKEEVLEGMRADEWCNEILSLVEYTMCPTPYTYEIYLANSIAVLHIRTFDGKLKEDFLKLMKEFKKEVDKQNIKSVFYDLTMNGGGHHMGCEALDIIKHDTVYVRRTEVARDEDNDIERRQINKAILFPNCNDNNIPNDRLLFVIQSAYTTSNADYFCRTVSENKLGILVGEPTGELTKTFSLTKEYVMPNTHTTFNIASTLVDYSDYFKSLTTQPDINWDLKNIRKFTEQELLNIINYYKKTKK